jgi:hypothetical protein
LASSALIVAIAAAIVVGVFPLPAGSTLSICVPLLLITVVITSWLKMRDHDRRLCEWCMTSMPLNAAEVAGRLRRRFAIAHSAARRRVVVAYLVVLVGSNGLLWLNLPGRLGWAVVQSSMIYLVLASTSHRRFQPWCPQCRDDGGGEDRVDRPQPLPSGGAG